MWFKGWVCIFSSLWYTYMFILNVNWGELLVTVITPLFIMKYPLFSSADSVLWWATVEELQRKEGIRVDLFVASMDRRNRLEACNTLWNAFSMAYPTTVMTKDTIVAAMITFRRFEILFIDIFLKWTILTKILIGKWNMFTQRYWMWLKLLL